MPRQAAQRRPVRWLALALLHSALALPATACAADGGSLGGRLTPTTVMSDDETASGSYLAGRFALDSGDFPAAAANLEVALAADPENRELRRQVFLLRLAAGDETGALRAARDLIELGETADEALMLLGLDRAKAGDFEAAQAHFAGVAASGVVGLPLPVLSAWAEFGSGERDDAIQGLAAGGTQGVEVLKAYHRAIMLSLADRRDQAVTVLESQVRDPAAAPLRVVQTLAPLLHQQGDEEAAAELVARARRGAADNPQLEALEAAITSGDPIASPITKPTSGMADALIGVAEALSEQQAGTQGLLLARAATYVAPDLADTWLVLGRVLLAQNNPAEAARVLERVPADTPQAWSARLLRAQALSEQRDVDGAVALLREMAAARPERSDALVTLGDQLRREERYAEAEAAYGEAIARASRAGEAPWRLYYARGMALERLERWPEAEGALQKALQLEPEQPLVLNYLGYSWVDQGLHLDRALGMLQRAVELRPEDGYIVDSLGWAYFRLGQFERATSQLERAVELQPGDPVINDHLGDAYWRVGRRREARFQWQRALTFDPEPDVVGQIQAKLERGLPANGARNG